jgi:hypothetical protein
MKLIEYFKNRIILRMNHYDSYMNISFEKEAYKNEQNMSYMP